MTTANADLDLDALEALFREWKAQHPKGAPWPIELVPRWTIRDRLAAALINAAPALIALARSQPGYREGWEAGREALMDIIAILGRVRVVEFGSPTTGRVLAETSYFARPIQRAREAIRALPLPESAWLREGPNVWIGYCDICNGQHCVTMLEATGTENIRRPHLPLPESASPEKEVVHPAASSDERDRLAGTATPGVTLKDAKEGVAPECAECWGAGKRGGVEGWPLETCTACGGSGLAAPAPVETREPADRKPEPAE